MADGTVTLEIVPWLTRFFGEDNGQRIKLKRDLQAGETVGAFLRRVGEEYPEFGQALWDPETGELGEHIEIIVNNAVLGIDHEVDTPLKPGERVTLVPAYIGGCS